MSDNKKPDYSNLSALFINCTLKPSPAESHTQGLMKVAQNIMRDAGAQVEEIRAVDFDIAPGVYPDMTEHGQDKDEWPIIWEKVEQADILIIGTPIWLGERSSVASRVIERLYAHSGQYNDRGQYVYYGKVGGSIITGNEDGVKHVAMGILYALQHLGYIIPPEADAGWIGAIGLGPSYMDEGSGGPESDFTQRHITFLSWNCMHLAAMLKEKGGVPTYGNNKKAWSSGNHFNHPNPEYR